MRLLVVASLFAAVLAFQQYCRCECAGNYTILEVALCGACELDFCAAEVPACADTKVVLSCFQRESVKDQVIVYGFVAGVVGLVGYALYGER